jgi:DNA replication protein DnaC
MSGDTTERIRRHLIGLKMPRALEALQMTLSRIEQGELSALEAIELLLGEEYTTRESRRIKMALQTARLPTVKTLSGYDFSFQPSLDRNRVLALAELEFVTRHQCVHLLGPPGTGKSHLAIALGVEAVRAGKSVYMATLAEMVDSMRRAEREGRLTERVRYLARHSVLIVDEIGYLPVGSGGGNLFFQLVNACYERCAMIMTSNRGFGEWADIFGDSVVAAALLDRLLHHAVVIPMEIHTACASTQTCCPSICATAQCCKAPIHQRSNAAPAGHERKLLRLHPAEHRNRYRVGKFTPAELGKSSPVLTGRPRRARRSVERTP